MRNLPPFPPFNNLLSSSQSQRLTFPRPTPVTSTTELRIIPSDTNPSLNGVTCQAYRDAAGTEIGSAPFTSLAPALIATNPVTIGSVFCSYREANPPLA